MDAAVYQRLHPHTYLERFLERGIRIDGRKEQQWRRVGLNVGAISTADGSALVKLGETTVVCGVKAEIAEPELDVPDDGYIVPNIDLPPLCSPKYRPGPPPDESQVLSDRLFQVLSTLVDTKSLSIHSGKAVWTLYIDAVCLNHAGNIFDATLLAMLAALKNTRLPKGTYDPVTNSTLCSSSKDLYTPITFLISEDQLPLSFTHAIFHSSQSETHLLSDPSSLEEPLCSAFITTLVRGDGEMVGLTVEGAIPSTPDGKEQKQGFIERCIQDAKVRRQEIKQECSL